MTDTGEGLHREIATRAFHEPFVIGEDILRKERAGLGLGLHLARQLVVLHGGIMWAEPLPSGGTRVAFCIPEHAPFFDKNPSPAQQTTRVEQTAPGDQPAISSPAAPNAAPSESELQSLLQQLLQE